MRHVVTTADNTEADDGSSIAAASLRSDSVDRVAETSFPSTLSNPQDPTLGGQRSRHAASVQQQKEGDEVVVEALLPATATLLLGDGDDDGEDLRPLARAEREPRSRDAEPDELPCAPSASSQARRCSLGEPQKVWSLADVESACRDGRCCITARGVVYDVTSFVDSHPGGSFAVLSHAGEECTVDFDFHSASAQRNWTTLRVGRLERVGFWRWVLGA